MVHCVSAVDIAAGASDVPVRQGAAANDKGEIPLGGGVFCGVVGLPPAPLVFQWWVSLGRIAPNGSLMRSGSMEATARSSIVGVAANNWGGRAVGRPGAPVTQIAAVVGRRAPA